MYNSDVSTVHYTIAGNQQRLQLQHNPSGIWVMSEGIEQTYKALRLVTEDKLWEQVKKQNGN